MPKPPLTACLIGAFYAMLIGYLVTVRAWGAAAGVFVYGLALGLGSIYQLIRGPHNAQHKTNT